ncbi:MAG: DUF421 domain-containing protein [Firmicutes bacterium]|nr:DUF421 domain-containing protein [Clostridia bacterium]MBS6464681.1 DUF421 domain-containing protein [Bacillota bacterium]
MLVISLRTLIIYLTLIVVMRFMGKRQIGEMQPFEFVITLIIADLACVPMADVSIPLLYGIVSILVLFLLHQLISLIEQSGDFAKRLVSGKPSVVITREGVNFLELKRNNLGVEDLIESMRAGGYFSLDDADYAIFEANGNLSVLAKQNREKPPALPLLFISEGKINTKNLELTRITKEELAAFLKEQNASVRQVSVMTLDNNGKVYLQLKGQSYQTLTLPLKEGVAW